MGDLQNASQGLYSDPGSSCFVPLDGSQPPCLSTSSPRTHFQPQSFNSAFPDPPQLSDLISGPSIPISLLSAGAEFEKKERFVLTGAAACVR